MTKAIWLIFPQMRFKIKWSQELQSWSAHLLVSLLQVSTPPLLQSFSSRFRCSPQLPLLEPRSISSRDLQVDHRHPPRRHYAELPALHHLRQVGIIVRFQVLSTFWFPLFPHAFPKADISSNFSSSHNLTMSTFLPKFLLNNQILFQLKFLLLQCPRHFWSDRSSPAVPGTVSLNIRIIPR